MNISEIFYSIQGEGYRTGVPTIFIRFFGCNYDCPFCDEPLHKTTKIPMSEIDILTEIAKYPCKDITITGGEPTLQDLNSFIKMLQADGNIVSVETNGHQIDNIKSAEWITCSPKFKDTIQDKRISEYKYIVKDSSDLDDALKCLEWSSNVYIQPENNMYSVNQESLKYCMEQVLVYPSLKLSVQLHKILGVE